MCANCLSCHLDWVKTQSPNDLAHLAMPIGQTRHWRVLISKTNQQQIQPSMSLFIMPSVSSFKLVIKMLTRMWPSKILVTLSKDTTLLCPHFVNEHILVRDIELVINRTVLFPGLYFFISSRWIFWEFLSIALLKSSLCHFFDPEIKRYSVSLLHPLRWKANPPRRASMLQ